MCKITCNELDGLDREVSIGFESWFKYTFGVRNVSVREVLCAYINEQNANAEVVEHLLGLQEYRSLVFRPDMDRWGAIDVDAMLFVPASSNVQSRVHAKGIYSNGDVVFSKGVQNDMHDIRINGKMTAESLECRRSACVVQSLEIRKGDLLCEGDLIIERYLQIAGRLKALSHVKALRINVQMSALLDGGVEVSEEVIVGSLYKHTGSLEISQTVAIGIPAD